MSIYDDKLRFLIKISKKEKEIIDGKEFTIVIKKIVCQSKKRFKEEFKKLGKYQSSKYEITTYENIRRRWYECPKPKI